MHHARRLGGGCATRTAPPPPQAPRLWITSTSGSSGMLSLTGETTLRQSADQRGTQAGERASRPPRTPGKARPSFRVSSARRCATSRWGNTAHVCHVVATRELNLFCFDSPLIEEHPHSRPITLGMLSHGLLLPILVEAHVWPVRDRRSFVGDILHAEHATIRHCRTTTELLGTRRA